MYSKLRQGQKRFRSSTGLVKTGNSSVESFEKPFFVDPVLWHKN
jgi:hypothetical protein